MLKTEVEVPHKIIDIHASSRHGGWLTFGNLDLHLIKGIPAVHANDEVQVGHITIEVSTLELNKIKEKLQELGVVPMGNQDMPDQVFEEPYSLSKKKNIA